MVFAHRRVDGLSRIAETRLVAARRIAGAVMVSLSCGVLMCASVAAAGPRFSAPVFRPTGTDDVWDFVAADVDADGNPDVVTISYEESELSVLRGRGDGTFLPPLTYQGPGEPYARLAVVDVNADGRPDLIITSFDEGAEKSYVDVLLNDGAGHFRRHGRYTTRGELHDGVAAADVNGDGIVDLVAAVEVFSDAPRILAHSCSCWLARERGGLPRAASRVPARSRSRSVTSTAMASSMSFSPLLSPTRCRSGSATATARSALGAPSGHATSATSNWPILTMTGNSMSSWSATATVTTSAWSSVTATEH